MYELTYEEVEKHINGVYGSLADRKLIKFAKEFVVLDKEYIFYPRNFYLSNGKTELVFFNRDEVISIKEQEKEKEVKVKFIKIDGIKSIEFTSGDNKWEKSSLLIILSNGESIELDSGKDATEDTIQLYNQIIGRILKEIK